MTHSALAVYTRESTDEIFDAGGTLSWVLDQKNALQCDFAVLCYNPAGRWSKNALDHGAAFMVGRISNVIPSPELPRRWLVLFDEYAEVNFPDIWRGWRNPVKYSSLEEMGIEASMLAFKPMPERDFKPVDTTPVASGGLTIEAAKAGLALTFGVKPEAVEITIRG